MCTYVCARVRGGSARDVIAAVPTVASRQDRRRATCRGACVCAFLHPRAGTDPSFRTRVSVLTCLRPGEPAREFDLQVELPDVFLALPSTASRDFRDLSAPSSDSSPAPIMWYPHRLSPSSQVDRIPAAGSSPPARPSRTRQECMYRALRRGRGRICPSLCTTGALFVLRTSREEWRSRSTQDVVAALSAINIRMHAQISSHYRVRNPVFGVVVVSWLVTMHIACKTDVHELGC